MNSAAYGDIFGFEPGVEENNSTNALETLLENVNSDHLEKRHLAVSGLAEALSIAEDNGEEDRLKVLQTLHSFVEDTDTSVRRVLTAQLTEIVNRWRDKTCFKNYLSDFIFPTFLKSTTDSDSEVRKTAHENLVNFVKLQNLSKEEVIHLLVHTTESVTLIEAEELRSEIVSLMADLCSVISRTDVSLYLLPTFLNLCLDTAFSIRKACGMNFGKFCANVDQETFERDLLPKFTVLCHDSVWGVRKACAESFVDVAILGPSSVRQELFVRLLLSLLNDVSRWVRVSAYQALGPFIATFASDNFNVSSKLEKMDVLEEENSREDLNATSLTAVNSQTGDNHTKPDASSDREIDPVAMLGVTKEAAESAVTAIDNVSSVDAKPDATSEGNGISMISKGATVIGGYDVMSDSKIKTPDEGVHSGEVNVDLQLGANNNTLSVDTDLLSGEDLVNVIQHDNDVISSDADVEAATFDKSLVPGSIDSMTTEAVAMTEGSVTTENATDNLHDKSEDELGVETQEKRVECQSSTISDKEIVSHDGTCETLKSDATSNAAVTALSNFQDGIYESLEAKESSDTQDRELEEESDKPTAQELPKNEINLKPNSDLLSDSHNDVLQPKTETTPAAADDLESLTEICKNQGEEVQVDDDKNNASAKDDENISEDTAVVIAEGLDIINIDNRSCDDIANVDSGCENSNSTSVRTASVSELSEPKQEVVRNIGSVHVHVKDQLNVVDGVVQPTDDLVKINITHQDVFTLQQESLDVDESKEEEKICRANVIHIPPESPSQNSNRPYLMKKCQGSSRFGFPLMPQRMAYYDEDSDVENDVNPEKLSLESANKELAAIQSVVPCELLEQYLNMAEPSRAQTIDTDILKHCAFSFPAVAYTLGQKNWTCLQRLYRFLARNMQWQVRRTLALSIHKMALILGDDLIISELLPVFDELIKDLDEVRSGIVKNLSEFLQLLPERVRICYLPKLESFLMTETNTRWRYRQDFAQQLISLVALFSVKDVHLHILPIAFVLASDKVSDVRHSVMHLLSAIVKMLSEKDRSLLSEVLDAVKNRLLESSVWRQRQLYISFSQSVLDDEALSFPDFLDLLLPNLVKLREDPVPNVRIALGRFLSHIVMTHSDSMACLGNLHEHELQETLEILNKDKDHDVRYFVDHMTSRLLSIV